MLEEPLQVRGMHVHGISAKHADRIATTVSVQLQALEVRLKDFIRQAILEACSPPSCPTCTTTIANQWHIPREFAPNSDVTSHAIYETPEESSSGQAGTSAKSAHAAAARPPPAPCPGSEVLSTPTARSWVSDEEGGNERAGSSGRRARTSSTRTNAFVGTSAGAHASSLSVHKSDGVGKVEPACARPRMLSDDGPRMQRIHHVSTAREASGGQRAATQTRGSRKRRSSTGSTFGRSLAHAPSAQSSAFASFSHKIRTFVSGSERSPSKQPETSDESENCDMEAVRSMSFVGDIDNIDGRIRLVEDRRNAFGKTKTGSTASNTEALGHTLTNSKQASMAQMMSGRRRRGSLDEIMRSTPMKTKIHDMFQTYLGYELTAESTQEIANWVLHPTGMFRTVWNTVVALVLLENSFVDPLRLAFYPDAYPPKVALAISDSLLVVDLALNFVTGYVGAKGVVHTNLADIAWRYLKWRFWMDLLGTIPWDNVTGGISGTDYTLDVFSLHKVLDVRSLRLVHLVRLLSFGPTTRFANLLEYLGEHMVRLVIIFCGITVLLHWFNCMTFAVARGAKGVDVWIGVDDFLDAPAGLQYTAALYWTTNVMLGERSTPQDQGSTLYSLALFWVGTLVSFAAFSSLLAHWNSLQQARNEFKRNMQMRMGYMTKLDVPPKLRGRIVHYFTEMHRLTQGVDSKAFLNDLPHHLRQEVAIFLNKDILKGMPVFEQCSTPFLSAIIMRLVMEVAVVGDVLCCEGDYGTRMYFILEGEVDVLKGGEKIGTLGPGNFFGEGCLTSSIDGRGGIRNATVQACQDCILYTLNKPDFDMVCEAFPGDRKIFTEFANVRTRNKRMLIKRRSSRKLLDRIDSGTFKYQPIEHEEYRKWLKTFDFEQHQHEYDAILKEDPLVDDLHARMVPKVVDEETFWARYFYKMFKLDEIEIVQDQDADGAANTCFEASGE